MTLVDTSVWVEHLRSGDRRLADLLEQGEVVCHPFVVGELACGRLKSRQEVLGLLAALPSAPVADHDEVLGFVESHDLARSGLGWVDVHLLAAARLARVPLWTFDRRLERVALRIDVAAP